MVSKLLKIGLRSLKKQLPEADRKKFEKVIKKSPDLRDFLSQPTDQETVLELLNQPIRNPKVLQVQRIVAAR